MEHKSEAFSQKVVTGQVHLRILSTTDLHASLTSYDYVKDKPNDAVGLTRLASLIRMARAEARNSLLLDNGDLLQGTPLGDLAARDNSGRANPIIAALNALQVDAATLGNHDFNFGLAYLDTAVAQAAYPVVLANIVRSLASDPSLDTPYLPPWTILRRSVEDTNGIAHELNIGVLGLAPPQIIEWEAEELADTLVARPVEEAAKAHIPGLKAAGADIIVVLLHGGPGLDPSHEGIENKGMMICALEGVDAVIMGHLHNVFPQCDVSEAVAGSDHVTGHLHGTPAVMAGHSGTHLGVIDMALSCDASGRWHVCKTQSDARAVTRRSDKGHPEPLFEEDRTLSALLDPMHTETLRHIRQVVAHTNQPLFSYFNYLGVDPALRAVARVMIDAAKSRLQGSALGGLPIVAAAAPAKAGAGGPWHFTDVPKGDVALRGLADLYAYPDKLLVRKTTGGQLRIWLERAAAAFLTVAPGTQDAPLIDTRMPPYHFDIIEGLTYRIDVTARPRTGPGGLPLADGGSRVRALRFNGAPVDDAMEFILVTNNYRAGGGGGYPVSGEAVCLHEDIPELIRKGLGAITMAPLSAPCWQFDPAPGTSVRLRTGAGARAHLGVLRGMDLTALGTDADGYDVYRLSL